MANEPITAEALASRRFLARRRDASPVLGRSIVGALEANPDQVATQRDLARRSGLPLPLVEEDQVRAEREARLREIDHPQLSQRSPATARVLENQEIAQVAHDDVENMSLLERYAGEVSQRFDRGERVRQLGKLGFEALLGIADELDEFQISRLEGLAASERDFGIPDEGVLGFFAGIPGAVAEVLPQVGESTVSGFEGGLAGGTGAAGVGALAGAAAGPGGAAAGAAAAAPAGFVLGSRLGVYYSAARMEAGHSFLELRGITDESGKPIDPLLAQSLALSVGAVAGFFEQFAFGKITKHIPGVNRLTGAFGRESAKAALANPSVRRVFAGIAGSFVEGAATEGITEGIQEFLAISGSLAGEGITAGKGIDDFTFETRDPETGETIVLRGTDAIWTRVMGAVLQGAQAGGGIAATGRITQAATNSKRAQAAMAKMPRINALTQSAVDSKLRERDNEAFREHVKQVAEETGVENVYIDSNAVREYFEAAEPAEAQALIEAVPALRDQDEDVARSGADFVVPLEDYLSSIAPGPAGEFLGDAVRFDPLDMTLREAVAFDEGLDAEIAGVRDMVGESRGENQALETVSREVNAQLRKVHPDSVAAALTELTMARIQTRAQRRGMTVQELVEDEGLFRIEPPVEAQEEPAPRLQAQLDEQGVRRVLGDLREGRQPELEGLSERPVLETLRDLGGVDPGSELGTMLLELDVPRAGRGSIRGLFVEGGIPTADQIVGSESPLLQDAGLTDPETGVVDPNQLFEAVRRELAGDPLRTSRAPRRSGRACSMRSRSGASITGTRTSRLW
jgi:hypothetical protein